MADTIPDAIEENALGPKEAEVDGVRVSQHSLRDQIAADRYSKATTTGANSSAVGFRISRFKPPSGVGE